MARACRRRKVRPLLAGPAAAEKAVSGRRSALRSGNTRSRFMNVPSVLVVSRAPLQGGGPCSGSGWALPTRDQ